MAPAAPEALRMAARNVAPRTPIAGTSRNPAAIAPIAAPAVFAAYSAPASAAPPLSSSFAGPPGAPLNLAANQDAATGKVAPIAAAGMPRRVRAMPRRTRPRRGRGRFGEEFAEQG